MQTLRCPYAQAQPPELLERPLVDSAGVGKFADEVSKFVRASRDMLAQQQQEKAPTLPFVLSERVKEVGLDTFPRPVVALPPRRVASLFRFRFV